MKIKIAVGVVVLAVMGCGAGDDDVQASVSVVKSTGSVQCTGGGRTLAALQAELTGAGVSVSGASCGHDGMIRPAVCGATDGTVGIFEVPAAQRAQAEALNFTLLSAAPATVRSACP